MPERPPAPSAVEGPPRPHDFRALVRSRLGAVPVDPLRVADIVDELAQHVADDYADLIASGTADADEIARALAKVDPLQPVFHVAPLDTVVADSVAARRFHTGLVDIFAVLALTVAAVGAYGAIAYRVAERTREIGVRMALGASRARIVLMVVARGGLTALGVVLGIALSLATSRALSALLFSVEPFDLPTIGIVSLLVVATGVAAACIPARRASALEPWEVIGT